MILGQLIVEILFICAMFIFAINLFFFTLYIICSIYMFFLYLPFQIIKQGSIVKGWKKYYDNTEPYFTV